MSGAEITQFVKKETNVAIAAWDRFWFKPRDLYNLAMFRFTFGIGLFLFYFYRFVNYDFFFSDRGVLPLNIWNSIVPPTHDSIIPWRLLAANEWVGFGLHGLFLLGVLLLALGKLKRPLVWGVYVLHLVFINRNPLIIYGGDLVSTFWLLYLCLTKSDEPSKAGYSGKTTDLITLIGTRLIQLQLCIIYAFSGLDKVRGMTWWQGDAIWNTLANGQLVIFDMGFMHHAPWLIAILTFTTLIWEIYFPFIIWIEPLRRYSLSFGVLLHVGIGILLNIPFFSWFMICSYLLFIDSGELRKWTKKYRWLRAKALTYKRVVSPEP